MKKLILNCILTLCSLQFHGQVELSLKDLMNLESRDNFLQLTLGNGFETVFNMDNSVSTGFRGVTDSSTEWPYTINATYDELIGGHHFSFVFQGEELVTYDKLVSEIKTFCSFAKTHTSQYNDTSNDRSNDVSLLYKCPSSKFQGFIGVLRKTTDGVSRGTIENFEYR